ncbi:MAG: hypothetical protein OQJ93_00065, partial [Ignavibacteriaceae bacterium]|nr:hypothetical protein [Ignavibacteriaceae bacterium]
MFGSFFILMIFNSYAQEQERNLNNDFDSTYRFQGIIPPIEFQYNFDEMFSKSLTVDFPDEVVFDNNPSTIWLRTELLISNKSEVGPMPAILDTPVPTVDGGAMAHNQTDSNPQTRRFTDDREG